MLDVGITTFSSTPLFFQRVAEELARWIFRKMCCSEIVAGTSIVKNVWGVHIKTRPKKRKELAVSQHDTRVKCVICALRNIDSNVVAKVTSVPTTDVTQMPIGPASRHFFRDETRFYCPQCGVSYQHPPGQPDAADKLLSAIAEERGFGD